MSTTANTEAEELWAKVSEHYAQYQSAYCLQVEAASSELLESINFLRQSKATGVADELLDGVQASIIEVAGCLTLGVVRPAVFLIRSQIDMFLAWLYFKDHHVEWDYVCETGEGYKLKRDAFLYFEEYYPDFKKRYAILMQRASRKESDPYRLLSAHVHSQSKYAAPKIGSLVSLVGKSTICNECVELQHEVAEYLGDIVVALYGTAWASLPGALVDRIRAQLSDDEKSVVFG